MGGCPRRQPAAVFSCVVVVVVVVSPSLGRSPAIKRGRLLGELSHALARTNFALGNQPVLILVTVAASTSRSARR